MTKPPTAAQRRRWDNIRRLGCIICYGPVTIHHCETGRGGRKNHDKVLPLCFNHHQGKEGIHFLSRRVWEAKYGTEQELMAKLETRLKQLLMEI